MIFSDRSIRLATMVVVSACLGCGRSDRAPVTYVADDDPKMLAAMKKAQESTDEFIAALNSPSANQKMFSVKMPVTDGETTEHMWVMPVRFEGGSFSGKINNQPDKIKGVKLGQTVQVAKDEISDWMYVEGRKLVGGFTLRVLRDQMPESERADFDKSVPFVIE